ncbi:hypothetical protein CQA58_05395 [Helicobacter brantae]|uniref:Uncharacterized protein n=1 Tax=Helicobacter brantae TaxID=375927 RepID=A0A3D8IZN3_9HELI|nr:hypothetical protein CQA58_05395 [Helicobacter brantae]
MIESNLKGYKRRKTMINPTETTFALILLNLALELLLYSIAVVYKLVMYKALKLGILESCFPIFAPLVIPLSLFFKPPDWVILPITILGTLSLLMIFIKTTKRAFYSLATHYQ